ncbi:rod shape-determining protein RodA [Rhodobacter capsulatus]|jgi:rod shape determining protein RodA|uniref:Peptidoglycan glycosyltransferase MrdB n=1 Tax=Rhodobacter capsulatus (strain ATCC BAA-309 / NBRC 16581 / SB1003) TaxID=272942 RepID=D5APJ2_RHOCB|nr:rod shape-determining protein RodA [Rhodobacter capsulatus]ADE84564.1 rod shape-determining protein RodA [Rhodobacter capsulatus SB 1003]ETD02534.1 cell wall shape-determining protein [Rhodobacter capsulatus DE442]ETD78632.1 cell wall shape-determining protein [Rhodobacter capsulatus R121]ETE54598.1 cell wall shape-determining protein [Rhodobacter capsulatus Y262]MDS0926310.1 rod shape-determining protein RodA [Rhodobacter capsulatus]
MSYLENNLKTIPSGPTKILFLNWPLIFLLTAVAGTGFLMLYSVAGGNLETWAEPQMKRFGVGLVAMIAVGLTPIWFWRNVSGVIYTIALLLLLAVEFVGDIGMGAQRWLDLGPLRLQPSEIMKIGLVMLLAAYYDWLPAEKVSSPIWVALPVALILMPTFLVLTQPDLGTAVMLTLGGGFVMFAAGVSLWYFGTIIAIVVGLVATVLESRGTSWQLLHDYQFKRIDTFLDPSADPLGAGYNIMQAQIALGSGGWSGRGYMQGTQSHLNFLPEKHTDFIFTTLAEEFGFIGAFGLLSLYVGIIAFATYTALSTKDRYASLVSLGVAGTFFFFFAINMGMVMGLMPVVGVPLPMVSYGGTAMMILLAAFGLVQSAHVHRPR